MEENSGSTQNAKATGKGLGVAGLIIGIVACVFSFVPCLGMYAILPAIVGLVLSAIAMKQAGASNSPKGMAIGGLITSIIAALIAIYWIYVVNFAVHEGIEAVKESGALDSLTKAIEMIKEATDTIQPQH